MGLGDHVRLQPSGEPLIAPVVDGEGESGSEGDASLLQDAMRGRRTMCST